MDLSIDYHNQWSGGNGRNYSALKKLLSEIETVNEIAFPRSSSVKERRNRTIARRRDS